MFPIGLLVIWLSGVEAPLAVGSACTSTLAQRTGEIKPQHRCWQGDEVINRSVARRQAPPLPPEFDGVKVDRTAVVIKLCIADSGQVVRALVMKSSGNEKVDSFYKDTLSKRKFKPATKNTVAVPSVATIAVNWNSA